MYIYIQGVPEKVDIPLGVIPYFELNNYIGVYLEHPLG